MTHDERVFYHTYTTCETPAEHAERIVTLEELLAEMYLPVHEMCGSAKLTCDGCLFFGEGIPCDLTKLYNRMREMGVNPSDYGIEVE